ncbi:MAG: YbgC/FadM family acyl-CoA thioesterase [Campylobacteraceae bacterium]|nr:YbgC/FadM family acyl-CoA thioesterase [Campylobacteraceae bacterium]
MQIRIYYEDTDAGGVVYHTNYIKYCERARSQMFYDDGKKLGENNCHFVVKKIEAEYFKPALLGDLIEVKTEVLELKGASVNVLHTIYRGEEKLFCAKILIVFVSNFKPVKLTEEMREFFNKYFSAF